MSSRGLTFMALRNAAGAVVARLAGVLVGIILTPFVLGRLGSDLYGVLTTTGSAFEYLILLRGGLGVAMRRHVTIRVHTGRTEEAKEHYRAGFWWGLLLRLPVLVVGLLLAEPLCRFVRLPAPLVADAAKGVALLIVAALVNDTSVIFEVPTYATGNTSILSMISTAGALVRLGAIPLAFLLFHPSLTTYGGTLIVLGGLFLVALGVLAERVGTVGHAVPRPGWGTRVIRRDLLSYGGLALLGQGAALLYVTTDNLFIGRIYGPAAVTLYSLGARWLPMISGFVTSAVQPLAPIFTRLEAQAEEERTRAAVLRAVAVTSALAVPSCLVLCVLGDLFLARWVGPQYSKAWGIMIASLAPATIDISLSPVWTALVGRGRIGWVTAGDLIVAVGNVCLSLVLALPLGLGILGFALGNTAALLAKNFLLRPLVSRRETALPPMSSLFWALARAVLGGVPALVLLAFTRRFYGGSLAGVLAAGLGGGVICLAGSTWAALGREGATNLLRALGRMGKGEAGA